MATVYTFDPQYMTFDPQYMTFGLIINSPSSTICCESIRRASSLFFFDIQHILVVTFHHHKHINAVVEHFRRRECPTWALQDFYKHEETVNEYSTIQASKMEKNLCLSSAESNWK
ncbi:MAG: hypothetical protein LBH79_00365 [Nitrososphaerota archaeon]|jgi:hypothetical protein|nr:hypothetical protein [Nitrososphaerota archaeon]